MWGWLTGPVILGWSLGANDASNVFGTAVGTRTIKFRTAVICICIFCILGAVLQGTEGIETISGISQQSLNTAFLVSFSAAITVALMTVLRLPVSTSQAVVGSILGIGFASGKEVNLSSFTKLFICWVGTPVGAALISYILYYIFGIIWNRYAHRYMQLMDRFLQLGLIIAGSYGAYALGANNVANVVGVFANTSVFSFDHSTWALLGALSICFGVVTFSKRVMMTVGENLVPLGPFSAFVAVVAEALTVHLFAIIGAPVSTSQAIVGAVMGIGLVKGMQSVNNRVLLEICVGWISTPLVSALLVFLLYISQLLLV